MSAAGHSIVWNGDDLATYGLYVVRASKPLLPEPEVNIRPLGGRDGAVTQGRRYQGREIDLDCEVAASSTANRVTYLAALQTRFKASQTGEKTLVVDLFGTDSWNARLLNSIDVNLALNGGEFPLKFFASYPWAKAAALSDATNALSGTTNWSPTITSGAGAQGLFTVTDTANGSTSITITNNTTGQTVTYAHTTVAGETIQFLSSTQVVQHDTAGGTSWTEVLTGIAGTVPRFDSGTNSLTINGVATGSLKIEYYAETL